jgi:hypothetical protein
MNCRFCRQYAIGIGRICGSSGNELLALAHFTSLPPQGEGTTVNGVADLPTYHCHETHRLVEVVDEMLHPQPRPA